MKALPVLPSALVQLIVTLSTIAPAKLAGVVTVSADGSLVSTVQLPSPLLVPAFRLQSAGTPLIVYVTSAALPEGSPSARLIGFPEMLAGADLLILAELPARSVTVIVKLSPLCGAFDPLLVSD